jgi:hypothetical protein
MADCERRLEALTARLRREKFFDAKRHASYDNRASFRTAYVGPALVSVLGSGIEFRDPEAHPTDYWWTVNVDLGSGRFLGFDDIFRTDDVHRKRLDELIYASLRREWGKSSPEIATTFKTRTEARGELQPLLCPGGILFAGIFSQHWIAAVTTFVDAHDLVASGVIKDRLATDVISSTPGSKTGCGV